MESVNKAYLSMSPSPMARQFTAYTKSDPSKLNQSMQKKAKKQMQTLYPTKALSYKLDYTFARGAYGTFWQATIFDKSSPRNQEKVAVKIIPLDVFNRDHTIEEQNNELKIISKCHSINVLKYYTSFVNEK